MPSTMIQNPGDVEVHESTHLTDAIVANPPLELSIPRIHPSTLLSLLYRFSPEQYERLHHNGLLRDDDATELLDGWIIKKMGKNDAHVSATRRVVHWLNRSLSSLWYVSKEDPIQLAHSCPEPDAAILRGSIESFDHHKPEPAEVALVVEVANSSYGLDCEKRKLYAEAGIPTYWIVNLNARQIEVHSGPAALPDPDYRTRITYGVNDELPLVVDNIEIARIQVRDLLPPEPPASPKT